MATLFLYHVKRTDNWGYDEFTECVVSAASEQAARETHPQTSWGSFIHINEPRTHWVERCGQDGDLRDMIFSSWVKATDIGTLKVTLIGTADASVTPGVICANFASG